MNYQAHETAVIDEGASIGAGTKIWHFSHIMPGAVLGERCNIGQNVVVSPGVVLGANVKVQNNVSIYEGVTCDDDVFLGHCGFSCRNFSPLFNGADGQSRESILTSILTEAKGSSGQTFAGMLEWMRRNAPALFFWGNVGQFLREALDAEGFTNVAIMSYTAKYVISSFP